MNWLSRVLSGGVFLCLAALATPLLGNTDLPDQLHIISVKLTDETPEIEQLRQAGFRILGVSYEEGIVQVAIDQDENEAFVRLGMPVVKREILNTRTMPDERYYTYDEVVAQITKWQKEYPDILKVVKIGTSLEGRDIFAVKITNNVNAAGVGKSAILFNSLHHAREIMTVEVAMDIIDYLANNYGQEQQVQRWVNGHEIWVIPMVNPDGNNRVWTEYNMWRKNTRNDKGVDLNRNYPYGWGSCSGSSDNEATETYRGASPGSEPETQAVMSLVAAIKPVFNISYHSFSELVLYPYGCRGERVDNGSAVESIGGDLASRLISDSGGSHYRAGTPWELLYPVDGNDSDWMFHEYGVIPYVVEINSIIHGFQPDYKWRQPTVEKMRAGWQFLLDKLVTDGVHGQVSSDGAVMSHTVRLISLGRSTAESVWPLRSDGTFQAFVPAGMYRLEWTQDSVQQQQNVIF